MSVAFSAYCLLPSAFRFLAARMWRVLTSRRGFMFEIEGFILAGGASSRMGRDKARLRLGGATFVARIAGALHTITPQVRLVSARPDSAELNLPVVPDLFRECGALGGLHAALKVCRASW